MNNTERVYDKSTQWPLSRVFYNLRVKRAMSIAHTSIKLENMLFALPQILNPKYAKAKDISRQMLKYCAMSNIKKMLALCRFGTKGILTMIVTKVPIITYTFLIAFNSLVFRLILNILSKLFWTRIGHKK